jgi:adenine-specific DNA-methyltransferase
LSRPRFESAIQFESPKIIYPNICSRNEFTFDDSGLYANQKTFIITGGSKYLLGVLNSAVVMWLFTQLIPKLQNGFYEPGAKYMREFPIPAATPAQQNPVERLVERILSAKQRDAGADVSALERELDELVYALYGLTDDEIKLVEESGQR